MWVISLCVCVCVTLSDRACVCARGCAGSIVGALSLETRLGRKGTMAGFMAGACITAAMSLPLQRTSVPAAALVLSVSNGFFQGMCTCGPRACVRVCVSARVCACVCVYA